LVLVVRIMIIQLPQDFKAMKGLASEVRLRILEILRKGERNVNEIKEEMVLPQSTIATNIMLLEEAKLIETRSIKAAKGMQKICSALYDEFIAQFSEPNTEAKDAIEVEMPIGLFIEYAVSPPCGMCSTEKIIGFLDTPASFLEPERVKAGLLWFEKGYVVYQFPNNALYLRKLVWRLEVTAELSSETPGTNPQWRSDITMWVNGVEVGTCRRRARLAGDGFRPETRRSPLGEGEDRNQGRCRTRGRAEHLRPRLRQLRPRYRAEDVLVAKDGEVRSLL
jgi:predicted transcriptional regulator